MSVCRPAVCGCGSSSGLFALIEGMCVFVHGCVCLCVCVCAFVGVCVWAGGAGTEKCVWVWGLPCMHRWCWYGSSASLLQRWYEVRTKFVRDSCEFLCIFRTNFVRHSFPKCTVNVVVTNFVRSLNNLHELVSFLCRTNTLSPSQTAQQHKNNTEEQRSQPIAHSTATQLQHRRTTQSGQQQSPMRRHQ